MHGIYTYTEFKMFTMYYTDLYLTCIRGSEIPGDRSLWRLNFLDPQ